MLRKYFLIVFFGVIAVSAHAEDLPYPISFDRFVKIYDQLDKIFVSNMIFQNKADELLIQFPLVSLDNPDYVLTSVRAYIAGISLESTAWRILKLEHSNAGK